MNFKHKLSRRLAILRAFLLPVAAFAACNGADSMDAVGPDGPDGPSDPGAVVALTVKSPTTLLEIGQPGVFKAQAITAAGDTVADAVEWSASGGVITADGIFSSLRAGRFTIRGRHRTTRDSYIADSYRYDSIRDKHRWRPGHGHEPVDSTIVVVVPPDTTIATLRISPKTDTLQVSATQAFTVTARTKDGSSVAEFPRAWNATGGTIDGSGVYTAGKTAGKFRVIATTNGGSVADTVPVTVTPAPTPTPPPPTSDPLARIILKPATGSLQTGATLQFTAYGRTSAGDSVDVSPTYAATGGTIGSGGLYTAGSRAGAYRVIAASDGIADTAALTITDAPPTLAKVVLTPGSATVNTGGTLRFAAYGRSSAGDSIPVDVTFSASGGTITSGGLYTAGASAGTFRVVAVQSGGSLADTSSIAVTGGSTPPPTAHEGYFVTPSGSSSGDGSMSRSWDLKSVLQGSHRLSSGDTVWVREGTYRTGEVNASVSGVVIRAYPGERAAIDGNLYIAGANTTYWGLEVYQSSPTSTGKMGLNIRAPGTRLINCVIHDAGMSGVGFWMEAPNSEATGNIVYNNGTHGNLDHGFYIMNSSGTKLLRDNLVFDNSGYGFHMYGEDNQYIRNVTLDGNVAWNSGAIASGRPDFFAGSSEVMSGIVLRNNFSYRSDLGETADLGWDYGPTHQDLTYTNNYLVGSVHITRWSSITQSNNTVLTSSPSSGTRVIVRPNPYESGRANIVVYNWSRQGSVSADVSGVLRAGDHYEVRNAQNFATGTPVLSGTYQGGSLSLPMSGTRPAAPLGRSTATAPTTGPEFDVFVLVKVP